MGCFLKCFGGSKDGGKRRKRKNKVVVSKDQRHGVQDPPQSIISVVQDTIETQKSSINLVPELRSETEEQLSPSPRKRVTFNSNVTTYEPVSVYESTDSLPETNKVIEKEEVENVVKSRKDNSGSEDDSVISSVGSYPSNHRYQNCSGSDDEAEDYGVSDLEDEDDYVDDEEDYDEYDEGVGGGIVGEVWSESVVTATMESRIENSLKRLNSEEVNSPFKVSGSPEQEMGAIGTKGYVRDRSAYIHPVLNPVENLTQWKAVKSKGTLPVKLQKENFTADDEAPHVTFSAPPTFKQSSSSFKPKLNQQKNSNQEVAVDASLSNWLASPETTPSKKTSYGGLETITPERSTSQSSNSVISFEDRPILGALTVEELKQLSANSSPRKSPSRSPDEMPIIGSVGAYWKETCVAKDSGSASSFKGIPNTTSKYKEDKRVDWHSAPFETRLVRALNGGATKA